MNNPFRSSIPDKVMNRASAPSIVPDKRAQRYSHSPQRFDSSSYKDARLQKQRNEEVEQAIHERKAIPFNPDTAGAPVTYTTVSPDIEALFRLHGKWE